MKSFNLNADFDNIIGQIKPMHAVNNMPFAPKNSYGWDERMTEAGIPFGRLHDTGGAFGGTKYVDIPNVFPDFDADENDPTNYDFAFTDYLIARMIKAGVKPYYRLGVTIENHVDIKAYRVYPPKDFAKWARICEHVIMHYNGGWADGSYYNIEYWEIWNEPDNYPDINDNQMWRGTMEQYFELYEITAKHLKSRFPSLKIGGYASCGFYAMNNVDVSNIAHSTSRTDYFIEFFIRFLEYISERKLPLDFFGWHSYAGIADNLVFARFPREQLDRFGYTDCEIHLNEWNPGVGERGNLKDASNILSMMIALHDTPTDMCMYYDSRYWSSYCGFVDPVHFTPFKSYYSFYNFGKLYKMGSLAECSVDGNGVYALAAKDGKRGGIALSNSSGEDALISLSAVGADAEIAKVYITDEAHTNEIIETESASFVLKKDAIAYVEF